MSQLATKIIIHHGKTVFVNFGLKCLSNRSLGRCFATTIDNHKSISKDFKFKDHYEVISAINLIAWISHKEDHHPEITFGYSNLTIKFFTYAIDGLSENDFICAAKIDKAMKY